MADQQNADETGEPSALWGYRPVPDGGTKVPSPCGTEEANERAAEANLAPMKRKFQPGPINSKSGPGPY